MSGLLSPQRLWQGEPGECFEDGSHFCSVFSGVLGGGFFAFCFVELRVSERSAFRAPREPEGPACTWRGTPAKGEAQAGQPKAALLPLPKCSLQGAHLCSSLGAALTGCNLQQGKL